MKKIFSGMEADRIVRRSMEEARERCAMPPLRDVLKREHDEAQKRPRNEALEKWGPVLEGEIERDLERERRKEQPKPPDKSPTPAKEPKRDGPDMDMKDHTKPDEKGAIQAGQERSAVPPLRKVLEPDYEEEYFRRLPEENWEPGFSEQVALLLQRDYEKMRAEKGKEIDMDME